MCLNQRHNRLRQFLTRIARITDKDNSGRVLLADKYKPAKVFVFGKQDALFFKCPRDQLAIDGSSRNFSNSKYVISSVAKSTHNGKIAAFVR